MSEFDFQPTKFTIEELLQRRYYQIPRFQRPYSWDNENILDFWTDCIEDNLVGYFVGPMVGWRRAGSSYASIVDGQQRLTTIAIALAAVRDALYETGAQDLAQGIHTYLERPDRDNDQRYVLQVEESPVLASVILAWDGDEAFSPMTENEQNLIAGRDFVRSRLENIIGGLPDSKKIAKLREVRDLLLGLRVILVELSHEDDAYVVFETLNSRGKDLAVADLVKNHLLMRLRTSNRRSDTARHKWDSMRNRLDEYGDKVRIDEFIQDSWLSRHEYVGKRALFKSFKKAVRTKSVAASTLADFCVDAEKYCMIISPAGQAWTTEESAIRDALIALRAFGVTQPAPFLLALLRARDDNKPRLKLVRNAFAAVESFHFQATAISGISSSGGVSRMYARWARQLSSETTANGRAAILREVGNALAARRPELELFDSMFADLHFTNSATRQKDLIQVILGRLHVSQFNQLPTRPSLEHLLPQDQASNFPEVVGQIGNIFFFAEELNGALGNKPFERKKEILAPLRGQYDIDDVLAAQEWGPVQIAARTERLAKESRTRVWRL